MRKIQIIALAFAAVFAFSMVSASGASAFTLWDECMEVPEGTGLFSNNDCNAEASPHLWEFLEITTLTPIDSLLVELTLLSGPVKVDCLGFVIGSVGAAGENQVTELLRDEANGEPGSAVTEGNPVECELLEGASFCGAPVLASPDGLPWTTQLVNEEEVGGVLLPAGDLLTKHTGGENPGWLVVCDGTPKSENLCSKEDAILKVENLFAELEVDLTFNPNEEAECTNVLALKGTVEGTVSILLENAPERALRAM